jgi:ribosomal protein L40E
MSQQFENVTCTRCGGTGKYSWNPIELDRCRKCGGSGFCFTKRGQAAFQHYLASQNVAVEELEAGMFIWDTIKNNRWVRIESIGRSASCAILNGQHVHYIEIETSRATHCVFPETTVRAVKNEEQRKQQLAQALEYQATLTKTGKPAK